MLEKENLPNFESPNLKLHNLYCHKYQEKQEMVDEVTEDVKKQTLIVNYLKDSLNFATTLNEALPVVCTLLGSKQSSDVQEAINFFVSAFEFGLLNAMMGVRKMLSLIFSRLVFFADTA